MRRITGAFVAGMAVAMVCTTAAAVTLEAQIANTFHFPLHQIDPVAGTFQAQGSEWTGDEFWDVYGSEGQPLMGEIWYLPGGDVFSLDPWDVGPLTGFSPDPSLDFAVGGVFEFLFPEIDGPASQAILDFAETYQDAPMRFTQQWALDVALGNEIVTLSFSDVFVRDPASSVIDSFGTGWFLIDPDTNLYGFYDLWLESADDAWPRRGYAFLATTDYSWVPDEVEAGQYAIVGGSGVLSAQVVPEPATMTLVGLGLGGLALSAFRRRKM